MAVRVYYDLGTSNVRIFVLDRALNALYTARRALGAKDSAIVGNNSALIAGMKEMYDAALQALSLNDADVVQIYASGMATSPYGFEEIPHCTVPVTVAEFARRGVFTHQEKKAFNREILLVAGMKTTADDIAFVNNTRGEEIEVVGVMAELEKRFGDEPVAVILPGSHTHVMLVGAGAIKGIVSNFTGELFHALKTQTILAPVMDTEFDRPDIDALLMGAQNAAHFGFNRALYIGHAMRLFGEGDTRARRCYCEGVISGGMITALDYYCENVWQGCQNAAIVSNAYMGDVFLALLTQSRTIENVQRIEIDANKSYALEGLKRIIRCRGEE
ncbi:2-dehydro-3-deoxygalactonokinase [Oscillospiraceae bacterium LTW-04]|nr:2-dehydro-3-deoxygalactonokinase [Oscillospiraceae bacterium MB24-C1]